MGSRHRNFFHSPSDSREGIGGKHVDVAIGTINTMARKTVALMCPFTMTTAEVIAAIFPDDVTDKLRAARGLYPDWCDTRAYEIADNVNIDINFKKQNLGAPENECVRLHPERAKPLLDYVAKVKAIHLQFEEVKAVLKYFNNKGTPAAVRYYWPTGIKLCPDAPSLRGLEEIPTRYSNPPGIGDWLQPIKDSAATISMAALLPNDAKVKDYGELKLNFSSMDIPVGSGVNADQQYSTYAQTYNI